MTETRVQDPPEKYGFAPAILPTPAGGRARAASRPVRTPDPDREESIVRRAHTVSAALCGALAFAVTALATPAAHAANEPGDLASMSLEDLMELEVTSVSKRSQRLFETPAAVTVLTGEDIRRSGATNVPDALRMVPGLHVASIDSSSWAITSRGFNGQFANKLLVMIDGRSAYTPLFSGTYWDAQDVMLEDVERIEVVRGPGASVWGANAVNGVINIITKQARDTQGLLISSLAGNVEQAAASGRWGGSIGADADYRGYVRYTDRAEFDDGPLGRRTTPGT